LLISVEFAEMNGIMVIQTTASFPNIRRDLIIIFHLKYYYNNIPRVNLHYFASFFSVIDKIKEFEINKGNRTLTAPIYEEVKKIR